MARTVPLQHRLADLDLALVELLEVDRTDFARVRLGVAKDLHDVLVAGHAPKAPIGRILVIPRNRITRSELIESRPGRPIGE